jgi:hypothetical protein
MIKHIPWSAFKLSDRNWHRVVDAHNILRVGFPCSHFEQKLIDCLGLKFNSTVLLCRHLSTLWRAPQIAANSFGEETQGTQVYSLQECSYKQSQKVGQVLFMT